MATTYKACAKYLMVSPSKVLVSAGANAMNRNNKLDESQLEVSAIYVDGGPVLKRVWARSHGKRDILLKRMSHITVEVSESVGE